MQLAGFTDENRLGVFHLNRFYTKNMAIRAGKLSPDEFADEWKWDTTLLSTLNLGLEQTIRYLYNEAPLFPAFEDWILGLNDQGLPQEKIQLFNRSLRGETSPSLASHQQEALVLTPADLSFWEEHGYLIVRNAITKAECDETIQAIEAFLGMDISDPATWYAPHPARQGIMIQLFQHPALERNRTAPRIKGAFEQVWKRKDIWASTDRVSFNPPENAQWRFPGPALHWDVSLELPIPFGTQGLLYLSDTPYNQGAFTLVPGFQHRIDRWIEGLPPGSNPRQQDLYALGARPIEAGAGDFILWNQALPHGSSPNTAALPRMVQYINYTPLDEEIKKTWK